MDPVCRGHGFRDLRLLRFRISKLRYLRFALSPKKRIKGGTCNSDSRFPIFDGQVPPLLASRLDCALDVYEARKAAGDQTPLLVCCGGQGADEDRPEADAVADYLLSKGVPEIDIRREDQSTTTRENLIFGSAIVFEDYPAAPILISTNDYHALRTALLRRDLKLDARVLSAKTAKYYVPAAFLREFVAILRDYFWVHVGFLTLLIAFIGFLVWESLQMR